MKSQPIHRWDRETTLVGQIAAGISLLAFLYYFRHGDLLLYGDAVAHINIARRVFDSRTPGLLQLGTVWLPLPHLLMIPFLISDSAWQTGIGGSIPSLLSYVLGTAGIFRLVRRALSGGTQSDSAARISAWAAAIVYAANPNLIYMQSTAMTESLYLALFIWAVVHFSEFVRAANSADQNARTAGRSLTKCGLCLAGACLTRYDGWFLAAVLCATAFCVLFVSRSTGPSSRKSFVRLIVLAAAAPALWLTYNAAIYRNPLEFANGPYSARAIEQRSTMPTNPGAHDLPVAFSYFLKAGEENLMEGGWQRLWVALLLAAAVGVLVLDRRLWPLLLLGVPLPFYALSLAYGSVPIYVPAWWPFSYYNVRFGLELLPAFACSLALIVYFAFGLARSRSQRMIIGLSAVVLVSLSYVSVWRAQPVCYREAWVNSSTRVAFETQLASNLRLLPRDATLLIYLGDHVGALERAGIPLRHTINEGNHRPWKKPSDEQGLWERALADPQQYVDYVVAVEGDPVAVGAQKRDLTSVVVAHTIGQPPATIYWSGRAGR
jgi:hypothetical protein